MENVFKGMIGDSGVTGSLMQARADATNVLDVLMPDNPNFTIDDAHDWYRRLGIYDPYTLTLSQMKTAILQRMAWPVNPINQQTAAYIQSQLHAAGFTNCNVFANTFGAGGEAVSIGAVTGATGGSPTEIAMCGMIECNDTQCGTIQGNSGTGETHRKVANYIEEVKDDYIIVGYPDYRSSFFIAYAMDGSAWTASNVPLAQKQQLRQLILKLKSQQMVCWLIANWY